jgi:hypothetical protein
MLDIEKLGPGNHDVLVKRHASIPGGVVPLPLSLSHPPPSIELPLDAKTRHGPR